MKKNRMFLTLSVAACCMLGMSAAATQEFTSEDGFFTIEIPDHNWLEVESPNSEFTFTSDLNILNVVKVKKGDSVEEAKTSERFSDVLQFTYAHEDDLYVATAYISDEEKLPEVFDMMKSIRIKDITDGKSKKQAADYTIEDCDQVLYVAAENGLNLRKKYKKSSEVLTIIGYGEPVKVTGIVLKNGKQTNWYRVEYADLNGYVAVDALSSEEVYLPLDDSY